MGCPGDLPAELGQLKSLQTLDLSVNKLSGDTTIVTPNRNLIRSGVLGSAAPFLVVYLLRLESLKAVCWLLPQVPSRRNGTGCRA